MDDAECRQISASELEMVKAIARKVAWCTGFADLKEDFIQEGLMGLLEAKARYSPKQGCLFETYASHRVRGAMFDYLRHQDHLSRGARCVLKQVDRARSKLQHTALRSATSKEIAAALGVSVNSLGRSLSQTSIHLVSKDQQDFDQLGDVDFDGSPDTLDSVECQMLKTEIQRKIKLLDNREQQVLALRYWEDISYVAMSEKLNISPSKCQQLHNRALGKIRQSVNHCDAGAPVLSINDGSNSKRVAH
ncbi:sigma-70 family RNA polymerase sigma factor [Limnobacter sp.]|uniref:sigma-70 family RNA polymerase sigma factor n=1 Tax=Limnobacter sp. TaxID=2003368 RepID=UPI003516D341